jgi:hypothetical protein
VALAGCKSSQEGIAAAEAAVGRFRAQMMAAEFTRIYAESHAEFKKSISEQDLVKFLAAVSSKLGPVKSAERAQWNVNFHTAGTFVTLAYNTEFAKGAGTEQFVYQIKDGAATLLRYNINAPALVFN